MIELAVPPVKLTRTKKGSKYSKEEFQSLLATNDRALLRGVLAIYNRQTVSEQASGVTKEDNGVGFTGVDAFILSSFAHQIKAGRVLSVKQLAIARKKMPKYWRQLVEVAETNDLIKAARLKATEEVA